MTFEDLKDEYDRLKSVDFDLLNNEQKDIYTKEVLTFLGSLQEMHTNSGELLPLAYALQDTCWIE